MADKIYADGIIVKTRETQFGDVLKVSIKVPDFAKFVNANKKPDGWLNLDIVPRKEASQTGQTHYVVLDTWKPDKDGNGNGNGNGGAQQKSKAAPTKKSAPSKAVSEDDGFQEEDIPF